MRVHQPFESSTKLRVVNRSLGAATQTEPGGLSKNSFRTSSHGKSGAKGLSGAAVFHPNTPYIGLPVPDGLRKNPHIYAPEVFATADYNERFGSVASAIAGRGVGGGAVPALAKELTERLDGPRPKEWSDREFLYRVYEYARTSNLKKEKVQIEKVFAESADGDMVAAHIAFGNTHLCTEDRGRSAIGPSILDDDNRAWLKTAYGVEILTAQQLSDLF